MRRTTVLQHGANGPFHYVSSSRDGAYPTEGCDPSCTHETRDEAYEHHRQWLLDSLIYDAEDPVSMRRCEVCEVFTLNRVSTTNGMGAYFVLCADHATREVVEERHYPPGTKLDSYGSG